MLGETPPNNRGEGQSPWLDTDSGAEVPPADSFGTLGHAETAGPDSLRDDPWGIGDDHLGYPSAESAIGGVGDTESSEPSRGGANEGGPEYMI